MEDLLARSADTLATERASAGNVRRCTIKSQKAFGLGDRVRVRYRCTVTQIRSDDQSTACRLSWKGKPKVVGVAPHSRAPVDRSRFEGAEVVAFELTVKSFVVSSLNAALSDVIEFEVSGVVDEVDYRGSKGTDDPHLRMQAAMKVDSVELMD